MGTPVTQAIRSEVLAARRPDTVERQTPTVAQAANLPLEPAAHLHLRSRQHLLHLNHRAHLHRAAQEVPHQRKKAAFGWSTAPRASPSP